MKIDIYKSTKNGRKYLSVPSGTDLANMPFPNDFDKDLLELSPFSTSMELTPGEHRVALDSDDIIKQINEKGYAVHTATTTVTIKTQNG